MHKNDCFYLGKIVKKHSFKGEVIIKLDTDEPELYKNLESVFVDIGNNLVPFFIEKSSLSRGVMLRVKFEGISSEEDADAIVKSGVYLPLSMLPELDDQQFYYHEVIGFTVVDTAFGEVGTITSVKETAAQPLFEITRNDQDQVVFIPIVDDFIEYVDRKQQIIKVTAPEGLIDLYLT